MYSNPPAKQTSLFDRLRSGSIWLLVIATTVASTAPPRSRTVRLTYKTTVDNWPVAMNGALWIPLPHDSPVQKITGLTIDCPFPYRLDTAQYGNGMVYVRVTNPPRLGFTVTVQFTATRWEHFAQRLQLTGAAVELDKLDRTRWLQPDRLVPIDGKIGQWARQVVDSVGASTDRQKAKAIYDHIIATVKYDKTGTGWGRGDIYYACDARRGNCTDFHAIFIGYCRALGIPARFAIGLSLPTDRSGGQLNGYHCWAEFYSSEDGWIPIDASEAAKNPAKRAYFFGTHDEHRIEFSVGRDLLLYPEQSQPLNYFIYPYAEADGKPVALPNPLVTYEDTGR